MFGIAPTEILVALIVIVLLVKPEELPKFLRSVGRIYGQFMEYTMRVRQLGRETYSDIASLDREADAPADKDAPKPPPPEERELPRYRAPLDQPDLASLPPPRQAPPPPVRPAADSPAPATDTPAPSNSGDRPVS